MATENKKYIPALRFPEFQNDGEWNYEYGNMLYDSIVNKKHKSDLPILAITQDNGAIPRDEINYRVIVNDKSIEGYKIVEFGDFIISLRSFQGGIEYSRYKGLCSPAYIVLRKKHSKICDDFYRHYFKSFQYIQALNRNLEGIRDGKMVSYKQFSDIKLPCPSLAEQKKIADCLSSLDKYIDATKRKLELLKDHKKGLMQRLFPAKGKTTPELRFPEFIGTKEWIPKQLGSIGETFGGLSGKSAEDFGTGKPFVTYKQVFNSSEIDFSECALVQVSENEVQNRLQYGDILVTTSSETPDEVGYTAVVTNKNIAECYLNSFCFIYRLFDDESIDAKFLIYLFSSDAYRAAVVRIAQGITRFNISKNKFKEIELVIPENKNEQIKIAETLSSVDKQIAEYDKKIKALELHKKGLMQQLFPKL